MLSFFTLNLDRKVVTDVVIPDFSKAFDTVDHRKLLLKLNHYGIHKQLIQQIQDLLTLPRQFLSVDSAESPLCKICLGVPQGSVLGPILFLLLVAC